MQTKVSFQISVFVTVNKISIFLSVLYLNALILLKLNAPMQVPLSSIQGTGPDGRILKADIEDYLGNDFLHSLCLKFLYWDIFSWRC